MFLSTLFYAIFGAIIGSFLNVLMLRRGSGRSVAGRSACASCAHKLGVLELVPILSWVALWGHCKSCGSRISIQYPLVEISTAALFAVLGFVLTLPVLLVAWTLSAILISIFVYDLRHTIIPDEWAYSFAFLALLFSLVMAWPISAATLFWSLIAGPLSALPLLLLWGISSGRWMGFGDVKLALGIGWLLGPVGIAAVFFSFILGAIVGLGLLWFSSSFTPMRLFGIHRARFTMGSEVPFGPFLIASCITLWLLQLHHIDPLQFLSVLSL